MEVLHENRWGGGINLVAMVFTLAVDAPDAKSPIAHFWQSKPGTVENPLGIVSVNASPELLGTGFAMGPWLTRNTDGRLELFAKTDANYLYHRHQRRPGGAWNVGEQLAQPTPNIQDWRLLHTSVAGNPVIVSNSDGRLEILVRDTNERIHAARQATPGGPWPDQVEWIRLGNFFVDDPVVARDSTGALHAFARNSSNITFRLTQRISENSFEWTPDQWVEVAQHCVGQPSILQNQQGLLEFFVTTDAQYIVHTTQRRDGGWNEVRDIPLGMHFVSDPVVLKNADGRLEVFARDNGGGFFHEWQIDSDSNWCEDCWESIGIEKFVRGPFVTLDTLGRFFAFGVKADGSLWESHQQAPPTTDRFSGEWTEWRQLGSEFVGEPVPVATTVEGNAIVTVFTLGADGMLYAAAMANSEAFQPARRIAGGTEQFDTAELTCDDCARDSGVTCDNEDICSIVLALAPAQELQQAAIIDCNAEAQFLRGDANRDGTIDVADAVVVLFSLFTAGTPLWCHDAADCNDSGVTDLSDPIYLLHFLFRGGLPPPAPFDSCGPDPTEDMLTFCVSDIRGCVQ